ncbi:MAG: hypothetical protein ACPGWR_16085 [Ardenticatenaceae bacterium]
MSPHDNLSPRNDSMSKPEELFLHATLLSLCDMKSVEAWIAYSSPQTRLTLLMHIEPMIKMVHGQLQITSTLNTYNDLLNALTSLIRVRAALVAAPDSSLAHDVFFHSHPSLC